jgi:hypothetical protein
MEYMCTYTADLYIAAVIYAYLWCILYHGHHCFQVNHFGRTCQSCLEEWRDQDEVPRGAQRLRFCLWAHIQWKSSGKTVQSAWIVPSACISACEHTMEKRSKQVTNAERVRERCVFRAWIKSTCCHAGTKASKVQSGLFSVYRQDCTHPGTQI